MSVHADANAQKNADDNPELIEIIRELQEKVTFPVKENLKQRETETDCFRGHSEK